MLTQSVSASREIGYPESDGKPMADNTVQFRWIVTLQGNLDVLFRDDPNVFVAGDLLWYPVEGDNTIASAPDTMVVLGRPKGDRGSYQQWREDDVAPQVVFEVLSPSNRSADVVRKFRFYDRYGVEEYYLYDPAPNELTGWLRRDQQLEEISEINGWVSPRLGIRFELPNGELRIYRPDGSPFLTYAELFEQRDQAQQRAEQERQRADRLAAKLKSLGVEPNE